MSKNDLARTSAAPNIYTRAQHMADSRMDGPGAHRRYYGQFVNAMTIAVVVNRIGAKVLLRSVNPHFNDIALGLWDDLVPGLPGSGRFSQAGDSYTPIGGVCLAKEAARQWVEMQRPSTFVE
jgi:hypothetical protein